MPGVASPQDSTLDAGDPRVLITWRFRETDWVALLAAADARGEAAASDTALVCSLAARGARAAERHGWPHPTRKSIAGPIVVTAALGPEDHARFTRLAERLGHESVSDVMRALATAAAFDALPEDGPGLDPAWDGRQDERFQRWVLKRRAPDWRA